MMPDIRALIVAAGRGTRAGLAYPKTLFEVQGIPILVRLHQLLAQYDARPTVIVSADGHMPIQRLLEERHAGAELVIQPSPRGMGDAVLHFPQSSRYAAGADVILAWGDLPFLQLDTLRGIVEQHISNQNHFTFATRVVDRAYTAVSRAADGSVERVIESREVGLADAGPGERDIGLFVFRSEVVLPMLELDLPGKFGRTTGEHGFLYVIEHLVRAGLRVEGVPIATELDLVSLNALSDLEGYL